jgi:pimeloyl-ACP methyl ester carboxylesterase
VLFEESLIYFPTRRHDFAPGDFGLTSEEVALTTEDGVRLHAWFLPARDSRLTVLFASGNAGNISHRLDRARLLHTRLRTDVLLFDYRGYGRSDGSPDEEGTYRDARAAWLHLTEARGIPPERLVLFGESLGAAVAVDLAVSHACRALILESPFTSVRDMAAAVLPLLPVGPLLRTRYDSLAKIPRLRAPLLVLHGERDEVVPFVQGRRLFAAAPEPKRFFPIPGAGHNDTYVAGGEAYWRALADFLDVLAPAADPG